MARLTVRRAPHRQRGFVLVEWAVALIIAGIVVAGLAALLAWTVGIQARASAAVDRTAALGQAADALAGWLRQAGSAGRPAIGRGQEHALVLCGVREGTGTWRATVRLDGQGRLVLAPVGTPVPGDCAGEDLRAPRVMVPDVRFSSLQFAFHGESATAPARGCGGHGEPSCSAIRAVGFTLMVEAAADPGGSTPASPSATRVVTLRNPGGR